MYRHELKYKINPAEAQILKSRLKTVCSLDANADEQGGYRVSSLYFDDFCDSAIRDNLIGSIRRKKFRIRIYNGKETIIKLEKKLKNDKGGKKLSVIISMEQYKKILKSDFSFMKVSDNDVLRDFYTSLTTRLLRPKVIVDYDREAYVYEPGNVRITFDSNIRTSVQELDLLSTSRILTDITGERDTILEIKYTGFLPEHIKKIIQTGNGTWQAFSKYAACRAFIS